MNETQLVPFLANELTDDEKQTITSFRPKIDEEEKLTCRTINEKTCEDLTCIFCSEIHPT